MVLLAAGSPLVAGASPEEGMPREIPMLKVRVERAFYYQGVAHPVGALLVVPEVFATDLVAGRKATIVPVEQEPEKERAPRRSKEKSDAG
jgi:hypothetical protein